MAKPGMLTLTSERNSAPARTMRSRKYRPSMNIHFIPFFQDCIKFCQEYDQTAFDPQYENMSPAEYVSQVS